MAEPCPICNQSPTPEAYAFRPFCSKRCKLLDLSKWLSEDYRVAGDPVGDGAGRMNDEDEDA